MMVRIKIMRIRARMMRMRIIYPSPTTYTHIHRLTRARIICEFSLSTKKNIQKKGSQHYVPSVFLHTSDFEDTLFPTRFGDYYYYITTNNKYYYYYY